MNSAVSTVLNKVLGEWIEDLNPNDLNLSILRGDVTLTNLRIKGEALDKFGLPFEVRSGYIGRMVANIPWTSLNSSPLRIEISDVTVLLRPRPLDSWDSELQKKNLIMGKLSILEDFELINMQDFTEAKDPGFFARLVENIIDNVQVSVQRVYIRFEDDVASSTRFAVGIRIGSVSTYTTNSAWEKDFISGSQITYRCASLSDFAVYMDYEESYTLSCQEKYKSNIPESISKLAVDDFTGSLEHRYILKPLELNLKLILNKNTKDQSMPQIKASLISSDIEFEVLMGQIVNVFKLLDFLAYFDNFKKGVLNEMLEKSLGSEEAEIYRDIYKNWIVTNSATDSKSKTNADMLKNRLKSLDAVYIYKDIISQRKRARLELDLEAEESQKREEIKKISEEPKKGAMGKLKGFFFGGKKESEKQKEEEERKQRIMEEEEKLNEIILRRKTFQDNFMTFLSEDIATPESYVKILVDVQIKCFSIYLANGNFGLTKFTIEQVKGSFGMRPNTLYVIGKIENIYVMDLIVKSPNFPFIVRTGYINFEFDQLPRNRFKLRTGDSNLVINPEFMMKIIASFEEAISQKVDLSSYASVVSKTTASYASIGKKYLKELSTSGIDTSVELDIVLQAPEIFVPLSLNHLDRPMFVLDLGILKASNVQDVISGLSYDTYNARLEAMRLIVVLTCDSVDTWEFGDIETLISPVNLDISFSNCKLRNQKASPGFILKGNLGLLTIAVNDQEVLFVIQLIDHILGLKEQLLPEKPPTDIKPEPAAIENRKIIETASLKSQLKDLGEFIATRIEMNIEGVNLSLFDKKACLLAFIITNIKSLIYITSKPSIDIEASLQRIELLDKRQGISFNRIIYNPLMYHDVDEEIEEDAQIHQVKGSVKLRPEEDLIDVSACLSDIRIVASTDFISALLESVRSVLNVVETYKEIKREKLEADKKPGVIVSQTSFTTHKRFILKLSNFEVLFPVDVRNTDIEVLDLHFGVNCSYIMSEHCISYYDYHKNQVKVDIIKADDEASLELNHLGISIGYLKEEDLETSQDQNSDIMNPSRITIIYKSIKQVNQNVLRTVLDTNLESMGLTVGFRDANFVMELVKVWSSVNFKLSSEESIKKNEPKGKIEIMNDKIDFTMVCDALQITLLDDAEIRPYNLFNAEFSNLNAVFQSGNSMMNFSLSTILNSDYYNLYKASWEPFIENWTFSITGIQKSDIEPFELFLASEPFFNINLTYSMSESLANILSKLDFSSPQTPFKQITTRRSTTASLDLTSHSEFHYYLHNKLGIPLTIWLDVAKDVEIWHIDPNQSITFTQEYIDRVYSHDRLESKNSSVYNMVQAPASISVKVPGYQVAKGLIFECMDTVGFVLEGENGQDAQCTLSFSAQGIQRNVYVQSGFVCMNNSDIPISIEWNTDSLKVEANTAECLPLSWVSSNMSPYIRTVSEPKVALNENRALSTEQGFLILEVHEYKTSSDILQTVYQFNPALCLSNLSPGLLRIYTDPTQDTFIALEPGHEKSIIHLNPSQECAMKFSLLLPGDLMITSEFIKIRKQKDYIQMSGSFPCNELSLDYEPKEFKRNSSLDLRFRTRYLDENQSIEKRPTAKQVCIYSQFILNNHTDFLLDCAKNLQLLVQPHSLGLYNSKQEKLSLKMCKSQEGTFDSKWSQDFNVNTVGVSGLVSLESSQDAKNCSSNILLGIRIQAAPAPLIKTSIIHIVPRFILLNHLGFPIHVRQYISNKPLGSGSILGDSDSVAYQLEDSTLSKSIQISADGINWSSPFDIEKFEDFQIRFAGLPDQYISEYEYKGLEVIKKLLGKNIKNDWYKPQKLNNYMHYARVCVISEDEATIFVNLITPKDPEFVIWNMTESNLTVKQINCTSHLVPAKTRIPWCFDNFAANDKRLELKLGSDTEIFSIEKLKQKKQLGNNKVDVVVNGVTREMKIIPIQSNQPEIKFSLMKFLLEHAKPVTHQIKLQVNMGGIGLSIVDDTPVEKFYFSAIGIKLKLKTNAVKTGSTTNTELSLDVGINHLQLDNMDIDGKLIPVMFLTKDLDQDEPTPFLQVKIKRNSSTLHAIQNGKRVDMTSMDRWTWFEVQLQEMKISINQEVIYDLLLLANKLTDVFKKTTLEIIEETPRVIEFAEISSDLQSVYPKQKLDPLQVSKKAYFEFIHLGAMKLVVTFRSSKELIVFELNPLMAFGVLRVVMNIGRSIADISDSPLYFSEIFMRHSFQTLDTITSLIMKNFIRQGIMQFYKVIGSSDILGNPIGLVDKLGTGVFEFLNEPRKGALKGPKGFVEGVGKGVKSLVGNVISAGFGSVGKITGSLYNVLSEVRRDETTEELKESDNIIGGVLQGFKGGASDMVSGVKGIFSKPWRGAKKGGVKGFAKGIGSGLLGAVTAPLAAVLRVGNSIATGAANTGVLIAKGKVKPQGRQRFPRQFGARKILEPYNSELAQAQELLKTTGKQGNESMVYYMHITEETDIIMILTTHHILLLIDGELTENIPIQEVTACEVHKVKDDYFFCIGVDKKQTVVKSWSYSKLAKMYSAMMSLPTQIKQNRRLEEIRVQERYGRGCCGT